MGMLLGVPIFGIIYYIIKEIVNYILKKKKLSTDTRKYINLEKIDKKTNEMVFLKEASDE